MVQRDSPHRSVGTHLCNSQVHLCNSQVGTNPPVSLMFLIRFAHRYTPFCAEKSKTKNASPYGAASIRICNTNRYEPSCILSLSNTYRYVPRCIFDIPTDRCAPMSTFIRIELTFFRFFYLRRYAHGQYPTSVFKHFSSRPKCKSVTTHLQTGKNAHRVKHIYIYIIKKKKKKKKCSGKFAADNEHPKCV